MKLTIRLKKVQGKKKETKDKAEAERKMNAVSSIDEELQKSNNIMKDYEDDEDVIFR